MPESASTAKRRVDKKQRRSNRKKGETRKPSSGPPTVERQISHRWTPRLADAGWTPISDYFLHNYHRLKITHTEAMVVVHLMSFKWDVNAPFPGLKTIARRMGITTPSVRTHLRNLEKKGLLRRQMQVGTTNRFHLDGLFRALEQLMQNDRKAAGLSANGQSENEEE